MIIFSKIEIYDFQIKEDGIISQTKQKEGYGNNVLWNFCLVNRGQWNWVSAKSLFDMSFRVCFFPDLFFWLLLQATENIAVLPIFLKMQINA